MKKVYLFITLINCLLFSTHNFAQVNELNAEFDWVFTTHGTITILSYNLFDDLDATHEWYILASSDFPATSYTPVFSGYSTIQGPFTLIDNAQPGIYYTTVHRVYTDTQTACKCLTTQYDTLKSLDEDPCDLVDSFWPNGPDGGEILATSENLTQQEYSMFPNPTSQKLTIKSYQNIKSVSIYNLLGELIIKTTNTNTINVSDLTPNPYFINIEDERGSVIRKEFIKQ